MIFSNLICNSRFDLKVLQAVINILMIYFYFMDELGQSGSVALACFTLFQMIYKFYIQDKAQISDFKNLEFRKQTLDTHKHILQAMPMGYMALVANAGDVTQDKLDSIRLEYANFKA